MLRFILCLALVALSFLIGNSFAMKILARRRTLESITEALRKMKTTLCFTNSEIYPVISQTLGTVQGLEKFSDYSEYEEDFAHWWNECIRHISGSTGLLARDIDLLVSFSRGLGVTDIEGQISNCELYTELFSEQLSKAKEDELIKCRLYRFLGFSVGSIIALMLM